MTRRVLAIAAIVITAALLQSTVFAQLRHQIFPGYEFLSHVLTLHLTVPYQQQWLWLQNATHYFRVIAQPVENVIPTKNSQDQNETVGD